MFTRPKSRQFEHLQAATLQRLKDLIPHECPLVVQRLPAGGFRAMSLDEHDRMSGRYQIVAVWIQGYVACWKRVRLIVRAHEEHWPPPTRP